MYQPRENKRRLTEGCPCFPQHYIVTLNDYLGVIYRIIMASLSTKAAGQFGTTTLLVLGSMHTASYSNIYLKQKIVGSEININQVFAELPGEWVDYVEVFRSP